MDVSLSAEQQMFGRVAADLAADLVGKWEQGWSPESAVDPTPDESQWRRMAEAGWFALHLDEDSGGVDASCVDVCVLVEQLGRHTVPAPVIGQILAVEQLRTRGADPALLTDLAAGELRLGPVFTRDLREFARSTEDGGSGLVAVDVAGVPQGLVAGREPHLVTLEGHRTGADLTRAVASIGAPTDRRTGAGAGDAAADDACLAFALAVIGADLLGVMGGALDAAVAHAKTREQFGAPIGSFQAVAHLLAEALVSVEATRSALWYAAWAIDELSPAEALEAARTVKAFASEAVVEVVETAIQVLGGIGVTWESHAHVWQRRAHLDRRLLGDEHAQYRALAGARVREA